MFENLIIYGAPALTLGLGFAIGMGWRSKIIVETEDKLEEADKVYFSAASRAAANHRKFVEACREANALQDRLERIVEAFEGQQSGTAQKAVRMARGDA